MRRFARTSRWSWALGCVVGAVFIFTAAGSGYAQGAGKALSLDGIGDYMRVNSIFLNAQDDPVSFSLWIKMEEQPVDSYDGLLRYNDGGTANHEIYYDTRFSTKQLKYVVSYNPSSLADYDYNMDSQWHHITCVSDGTYPFIYIDGMLVATGPEIPSSPGSGSYFVIGAMYDIGTSDERCLNGQIDEVSVWNRVLSEAEIQANMTRSLAGSESGLVGYWSFDELDGSGKVPDLTGNGNDGTLVGDAQLVASTAPIESPPSYIVFDSERDGDNEIYLMNLDSDRIVQLTHNDFADAYASVSPDGKKIAFFSNRDGNGEIYVMDIDGSNPVNLTNNSATDHAPGWSPDGTKIVFQTNRDGKHEVYVMDADGSNQVNLTNNLAEDWGGSWSPDGTTISFTTERGSGRLWLMDADGSNPRALVDAHYNGGWSPDGTKLTFTGYSGGDDVYVINVDGTGLTRLTSSAARDVAYRGDWSPDGSKILFGSNRDGNFEIYSMSPDGSGKTNLTNHVAYDNRAAWVPVDLSMSTIPDTVAFYASSIQVPVRVDDTTGLNIISAEVFVAYDGDLLTATGVDINGSLLTAGWSIETNGVEGNGTPIDTLKIAMATDDDVLVGEGELIFANFEVADIRHPAYSPLELTHVLFNDGDPVAIAEDGSVTLVGVDGTVASDPDTVLPRWAIEVTVADADEDRDAGVPDAFDVAVMNGSQTETVAVTETGTNTGIFTGNIETAFSLSFTAGDGIVQAKAGDEIEFCYADSLDSAGNTVGRCATTAVVGGHDSQIRTTVVSQPGDTVRVRVIDADLSESVDVGVENPRTGEVESIVLSQFDTGDSHFYGRFFTDSQAGTVGDSTLAMARGDVVVVTYADTLTAQGGTAVLQDDDEVVDPFGDADGNGSVQAFDAAQVLWHRLLTYGGGAGSLSGLDSLSANVDSLAPFGIIDGYDASQILRKVVGLVGRFEVQEPDAANHPQPETRTRPKRMAEERELALRVGEGYVSVWADDRGGMVSGELQLEGIAGEVVMGKELGDFLVASRERQGGMSVVFAGAAGIAGPGELLRVYSGVGSGSVRLTRASFNGGRIGSSTAEHEGMVRPLSYALYANAPNPFNPETMIRYALPVASAVELTVYDVVGQQVRRLVSERGAAGMHEVMWDGCSDAGERVSSGVYFYRLEARRTEGDFTQVRRMLLLK